MTAPQNFRTAFNGFHREDVVRYIEYLNAKHESELGALNNELEQLRADAAQAAENPELQQLQEKAAQLEARCAEQEALEARCQELERKLQEAIGELNQAQSDLIGLRNSSQANPTNELEAYRRAERTEREARERAERVYRQANGALADATVKVDEAFAKIGALTDQVNQQLDQLQEAVVGSRQALADAAGSLYTIRPGI